MGFDRPRADEQLLADLSCGEAVDGQLRDLPFARAEIVSREGCSPAVAAFDGPFEIARPTEPPNCARRAELGFGLLKCLASGCNVGCEKRSSEQVERASVKAAAPGRLKKFDGSARTISGLVR